MKCSRIAPQACTSTIKSEDCEMCQAIADYFKQLGKATNETPVSKPTKGVKK